MATRILEDAFLVPATCKTASLATVLNDGPEIVATRIGIFSLELARRLMPRRKASLNFTWNCRLGGNFPSIQGELHVREIAGLTSVYVKASYAYGDSVADQLFHEVIGGKIAGASFQKLMDAVRLLVVPDVAKHPA